MIRLFKHYIAYNVVFLCLADLLLLILAADAAWNLRAYQIGIGAGPLGDRALELGGFALLNWIAMIAVGSYSPEALRSVRFAAARMMVAVSLGVTAIALADFVIPGSALWRSMLIYAMILAIAFLLLNRVLMVRLLGADALQRRILVLGAGDRAERLRALSKRPGSGFAILAFLRMTDVESRIADAIPRTSIGDLGRYVERIGATEVVLALQERRNALPLKDLLRVKTKGVYVNDLSSFLERETGRVDLDTLNPSWLIFSDGFSAAQAISSGIKRAFDIVVSTALLVVALPLIAVFSVLIRLESRGPAFFRQVRIGLYGEPFTVYKLRSMRQNAEVEGARWAAENDPRITRIGKIIRKVRIDELPQLWNVLKGDMSFVGPRPEVPRFVSELEDILPFYAERHEVKPGITGWAQINYPYGASVEDARQKLEYDLYYAKNYSPFLDVVILIQTVRVILWPDGAR